MSERKTEEGEEGLQKAQVEDWVEGGWGWSEKEEKREGTFHYAVTGEKTNPPGSMKYPANSKQ